MSADYIPLIVGGLVLIASLISLRVGLSVAIIEILLGAISGNIGLGTEDWMMYLATFGGIILTFLAGTEIDTKMMRENFKESFLIGSFSFFAPFVGVFLYTFYVAQWSLQASMIAGCAFPPHPLRLFIQYWWKQVYQRQKLAKKCCPRHLSRIWARHWH